MREPLISFDPGEPTGIYIIPQSVTDRIKCGVIEAVTNMTCVADPIGCGRVIGQVEFLAWDALSRHEFSLSGWCLQCQDKIFKDPNEEDECICEYVDVGVGVDMKHENPSCPVCNESGDLDGSLYDRTEACAGLREDEPPHDMYEVEFTNA